MLISVGDTASHNRLDHGPIKNCPVLYGAVENGGAVKGVYLLPTVPAPVVPGIVPLLVTHAL